MQWHDRPLLSSEWSGARGGIGLKVVEEPRSNNTASSELSSGRGARQEFDSEAREKDTTDRPTAEQSAISRFSAPSLGPLLTERKTPQLICPGPTTSLARNRTHYGCRGWGMRVTPICGWFVVPLYVQATPTKTIQPLFRLTRRMLTCFVSNFFLADCVHSVAPS